MSTQTEPAIRYCYRVWPCAARCITRSTHCSSGKLRLHAERTTIALHTHDAPDLSLGMRGDADWARALRFYLPASPVMGLLQEAGPDGAHPCARAQATRSRSRSRRARRARAGASASTTTGSSMTSAWATRCWSTAASSRCRSQASRAPTCSPRSSMAAS